ncbi:thioredoxin family protein [Thioalkalivibrio sp. XN8]|uniref:TlpA family protein disulfide reductase n=1 Tax=Thioalkalivibrio sp. XN8 TaxID=2712863 RepID=UPI0013EBD2D8|nr:thioredoxin family protein [Thioalkalivibrio sp. XN8]NGP52616.1 thioredoxin family protein [Thioalkalivibrio sp. XN8]
MYKNILPLFLAALALLLCASAARAEVEWLSTGPDGETKIVVWYFYSDTCPHCIEAKPFVASLDARDWIDLRAFEITKTRDHGILYRDTARAIGEQARSVPAFLFCGTMHTGFDNAETTGAVLLARLEHCRANPEDAIAMFTGAGDAGPKAGEVMGVRVPLLGMIDPSAWGLPILTVVIAGLDAFNPCAFFVLLFLLSLMVHARSRARMLLVGGTFVLISGLIYFVFMAAWLNVFLLLGELRVVTIIAGVIAVGLAAINIKDYFWFQSGGPSLSIPESKKPGMYQRMRNLVGAKSTLAMLAGTAVLAIVVNSYELLCTAGLPMVYTRILTLREADTFVYYMYLVLYNIIYVIPLLIIVLLFVMKFGSRKLGEAEGRLLKLMSGMMMLGLGALMLVAPTALNNAGIAILLLLGAVALTWVIHLISRRAGLI